MVTLKKPIIELTSNDNALMQLKYYYDGEMLINRKNTLIRIIANCNDTNEVETLVQEHDDVLLALVQMN